MQVLRQTLNTALALISKATGTTSNLPILTCVDLQAEGESLTLTATNLELTLRTRIAAQVDRPFATAVPTGILTSICAASEAETLDLVYDEATTTLKLKSLGAKSKIKALDHHEFPAVPSADLSLGLLPAHLLKAGLKRVVIAASTDLARPVLNGIQLAQLGSEVTLAAADGFRLAVYKLELPLTFPEGHRSLVMPRASVLKLIQCLPDDAEEVQLSVAQNASALQFTWQATSVWVQLLDFKFPDWPQILPTSFKHTLSLPGKETLAAIQRAEIFAREANHVVRFKPGNDNDLLIEGNSDQTGKSETALPVAMPFQIAFNSLFAKQGLEALGVDEIHLHLNAENAPALLTNGSDRYRYLIMPMFDTSAPVVKAAVTVFVTE